MGFADHLVADIARAALPIAAADGGMLMPALIFVLVNLRTGDGALSGWAIPTATDIAFTVVVLAVVDDLLAITVIVIFYTDDLNVAVLGAALIPLALFTVAVQKKVRSWWVLSPLTAETWVLEHESGIHATVAGVLLGFAVPVVRSRAAAGAGCGAGFDGTLRTPCQTRLGRFAVPVFAPSQPESQSEEYPD